MEAIKAILLTIGVGLCIAGAVQAAEGIPSFYWSRSIAELQSDANHLLEGVVWMLSGLSSFMLVIALNGFKFGETAATSPIEVAETSSSEANKE